MSVGLVVVIFQLVHSRELDFVGIVEMQGDVLFLGDGGLDGKVSNHAIGAVGGQRLAHLDSFGDVPDGGLFTLAVDFVAVERVLGFFVDLLDNGAKSRPVRVNDGVGVFGVVCNLGCGVRLGVVQDIMLNVDVLRSAGTCGTCSFVPSVVDVVDAGLRLVARDSLDVFHLKVVLAERRFLLTGGDVEAVPVIDRVEETCSGMSFSIILKGTPKSTIRGPAGK